jgi:hypothetical protein
MKDRVLETRRDGPAKEAIVEFVVRCPRRVPIRRTLCDRAAELVAA